MKQLLEKLTTLAAYTAAVCTIVILLVTSININCFNKGFYKTEYASLETAQSLGAEKCSDYSACALSGVHGSSSEKWNADNFQHQLYENSNFGSGVLRHAGRLGIC